MKFKLDNITVYMTLAKEKVFGRVSPLEEVCSWKKVAESEFIKEGHLRHCNLCDGYNVGCQDYTVGCDTKLKKPEDYYGGQNE